MKKIIALILVIVCTLSLASCQFFGNTDEPETPDDSASIPDIQAKVDATAPKGADVTVDAVNAAMKAQASESFGYNTEEIVSSDVIGMKYGSLFDATQTMVINLENGTSQVQVVSWYDNENSYVSQMVRTIKYFSELA